MSSFPVTPGESYRIVRTVLGDFIMGPVRLSAEPRIEEDGSKAVRITAKMKAGRIKKESEGAA